jgi:hypothetical protein
MLCRFLSPSNIQTFRLYDFDSYHAWRSSFLSTGIEIVEEREFHPEQVKFQPPSSKKLKENKSKAKTEAPKRKGKAKTESSSPSEKNAKKKKSSGSL